MKVGGVGALGVDHKRLAVAEDRAFGLIPPESHVTVTWVFKIFKIEFHFVAFNRLGRFSPQVDYRRRGISRPVPELADMSGIQQGEQHDDEPEYATQPM